MGINQSKPTLPAESMHATYPDPQERVSLKTASLAGENHKNQLLQPKMRREHKLTPPAQWGLSMQPILPPVGRTLKKGKQETTTIFFLT